MKSIVLIASASALALGLAACGEKPVARATLDCPTSEGGLSLKSKAADGKTCVYTGEEAEVTLQRVSTGGGPEAPLDRIENELLAGRVSVKDEDVAAAASDAAEASATAKGDAAQAEARAAKAEAKAAKAEAKAAKAGADGDENVSVHIGTGGVRVTEEDDGKTRVNMPGIHIEADEANDSARVQIGPIKINADGDQATVRIRNDHRMKGEALSTEKRGLRATFISKMDHASDGYRYVGFEAAGPKKGPITVGVLKAKSGDGENIHEDVVKLVRRNGGV
jgi:hypothetical protein